MSASIFFFSLFVFLIGSGFSVIVYNLRYTTAGITLGCVTVVISLVLMFLSLSFCNASHLRLSMKYDDVIVIEQYKLIDDQSESKEVRDAVNKGYRIALIDEGRVEGKLYETHASRTTILVRDPKSIRERYLDAQ